MKIKEGSRDLDENAKKRIKYLDEWIDKLDSGVEETHKLVVDELMHVLADDGNYVSIYRDMMLVFHGKSEFMEALARRFRERIVEKIKSACEETGADTRMVMATYLTESGGVWGGQQYFLPGMYNYLGIKKGVIMPKKWFIILFILQLYHLNAVDFRLVVSVPGFVSYVGNDNSLHLIKNSPEGCVDYILHLDKMPVNLKGIIDEEKLLIKLCSVDMDSDLNDPSKIDSYYDIIFNHILKNILFKDFHRRDPGFEKQILLPSYLCNVYRLNAGDLMSYEGYINFVGKNKKMVFNFAGEKIIAVIELNAVVYIATTYWGSESNFNLYSSK